MEKSMIASIVLLLMINITDSVTNSAVDPSLIFCITEIGGSKEEYGTIMSSTFLSGILMTSFYGAWVDRNCGRNKGPCGASFVLGMAGSLVYFLAANCPPGKFAMHIMLAGRLVTGMGSYSRTLAYTWVAMAIPQENQRNVLTLLSITRTVGMIMGPALNVLVAKFDVKLVIALTIILITPNNSSGLLLFIGEGLLFAEMYVFLENPPPKVKDLSSLSTENEPHSSASLKDIWNAVTSFDLALPMANLFFLMCNFTLQVRLCH